jgi:hypothetical protein
MEAGVAAGLGAGLPAFALGVLITDVLGALEGTAAGPFEALPGLGGTTAPVCE